MKEVGQMRCDLMLGDCLDLLGSIPDGSIDMVLCDLPYGMTRNAWDCEIDLDKLWRHYRRVVRPNGAVVLFASGMFTSRLMASNPSMWRYNLVWHKTTKTGFLNAKRMPLRAHEGHHRIHGAGHGSRPCGLSCHRAGCGHRVRAGRAILGTNRGHCPECDEWREL